MPPRAGRAGRRHPMPPGRWETGVEPGPGQRKRPGCRRERRARRPAPQGSTVSRAHTSRRCQVPASLLRRVGRRPPRGLPTETEAGEMPRQAGRQEALIRFRFPGHPLLRMFASRTVLSMAGVSSRAVKIFMPPEADTIRNQVRQCHELCIISLIPPLFGLGVALRRRSAR